eukprot:TRINITY_DN1515_c0_g4_i1.p3 TRINITY_DN1515_c0_g4~~TRINITY_DN1515_c0_g4_i1.p3  ORF type:complete len:200 (+),score=6.03 TRINITY_DN1515_c0_g4_i1:151-750(+)
MSFAEDIERAQAALSTLKCNPYLDKLGQVLQYKLYGLTTAIELALKCFDLGVQVSQDQTVDRSVIEKQKEIRSQQVCPQINCDSKEDSTILSIAQSTTLEERQPFDYGKIQNLDFQQNCNTWKQIKTNKRPKKRIVRSEPYSISTQNRFAILDGLHENVQQSVVQDYSQDRTSIIEESKDSSSCVGSIIENFLEQLNNF